MLLNFDELKRISNEKKMDLYLSLISAEYIGVLECDDKRLLINFIRSTQNFISQFNSQVLQDLFANFCLSGRAPKTFLEFGATDGAEYSNTLFLERDLGWTGALCEPSPQWIDQLRKNRPNSIIISDCIWKETGAVVSFFVSSCGLLSTINDFIHSDANSMPGNTMIRNISGYCIDVNTISLNDVMEKYFSGIAPSYISVDTEGSEYEILSAFDFQKYRPLVLTVEHNFTEHEAMIDHLMAANNYKRVFGRLTAFDAWYVDADLLVHLL